MIEIYYTYLLIFLLRPSLLLQFRQLGEVYREIGNIKRNTLVARWDFTLSKFGVKGPGQIEHFNKQYPLVQSFLCVDI
jgi:hypothetical protein